MINDFQHRLRQAIADKNITASELSRISGVGKSDISNYLNGVYVAKQDKCYMLAKALDVDPGWLMTGDVPFESSIEANTEDPQISIVSGIMETMTNAQKEQIVAIVKTFVDHQPK